MIEPGAPLFTDRIEAGQKLAQRLIQYKGRKDVLVLGLPRGGVPVASQVAQRLNAPLDIFLVRKLGVPGHEELAMGAIASGGIRVLNKDVVDGLNISVQTIEKVAEREKKELERREHAYRGDRPNPAIRGKTMILIDDGLATGSSMQAAVTGLRTQSPARIIVAVPVAPPEAVALLKREADEIICLQTPEPFFGIGLWYENFSPTSDEEVQTLLKDAAKQVERDNHSNQPKPEAEIVQIPVDGTVLEGILDIPDGAKGIVVFVHGSGSSRHSPRNQFVAQKLKDGGLGTLLFDLLTAEEEQIDLRTRELRFDIKLLAQRTVKTVDWLTERIKQHGKKIGLFGSSTGAAAALIAAAERPEVVKTVVSRGGRPDLAGPALPKVSSRALFLVGELDREVIELNEQAVAQMNAGIEKKLEIIPGATHLFEEPGTLEEVATRAKGWFQKHLG